MPLSPAAPDLKDRDRNDSAEGAEGGEEKKWIERSENQAGSGEHGAGSGVLE